MKFGPKRAHFMFLFQNVFKDFGLLILFLVIGLVTGDFGVLIDNVALVVIVFLAPVVRLVSLFTTYYSADEEFFIIEEGLLNKKKTKIPIKSITNIDFTQSLVMQLNNTYVLNIDNGAKANQSSSKIRIVFGEEDSLQLKRILLGENSDDGVVATDDAYEALKRKYEPSKTMAASFGDIFFLGFLKSSLAMMFNGFWIMVAAIPVFNSVLSSINVANIDEISIVKNVLSNISGLASAAIVILTIFCIGTVLNIIVNMIKYASFKIVDMGNNIHVEYGLFSRKQHTLVKSKICGIKFRQSLWMKIFKVGYIEVLAIGYGDNGEDALEANVSILYPMLKAGDFDGFVARWMPQLKCDAAVEKVSKAPLRYFFTTKSFALSLIFLVASVFVRDYVFALTKGFMPAFAEMVICIFGFWLVVAVVAIFVERRTNGIGFDDGVVKIASGAFDSSLDYVLADRIEFLSNVATKWKRRVGYVNVSLGILGPANKSVFKVRNIGVKTYENLKQVLKY